MDYAAKRILLIEQHNKLVQQIEVAKSATAELRGQIALLEQIIAENKTEEDEEDGSNVG